MSRSLSVREMLESDIDLIIKYWLQSDRTFLQQLGVDVKKLPSAMQWREMVLEQLQTPIQNKRSYCIIWLLNQQPVGHCNVNPLIFGVEAYMHLHLWNATVRQKGLGLELLQMSLPYFFNNLQLQKLLCVPNALNAAPNNTLAKAGFKFVKEYVTIPGSINFEQPVKEWQMTLDQFNQLKQ